MAGAAGVKKALKTFLSSWKGNKSAKLTLTSDKGDLSVVLELKLGQYCESIRRVEASRGYQPAPQEGSKSSRPSHPAESSSTCCFS